VEGIVSNYSGTVAVGVVPSNVDFYEKPIENGNSNHGDDPKKRAAFVVTDTINRSCLGYNIVQLGKYGQTILAFVQLSNSSKFKIKFNTLGTKCSKVQFRFLISIL